MKNAPHLIRIAHAVKTVPECDSLVGVTLSLSNPDMPACLAATALRKGVINRTLAETLQWSQPQPYFDLTDTQWFKVIHPRLEISHISGQVYFEAIRNLFITTENNREVFAFPHLDSLKFFDSYIEKLDSKEKDLPFVPISP